MRIPPDDGHVLRRPLQAGNLVQPGADDGLDVLLAAVALRLADEGGEHDGLVHRTDAAGAEPLCVEDAPDLGEPADDPLRRDLYRETKENLHKEVLKGTRWLLLKNPENLDTAKKEKERLAEALKLNEPLSCA